jgi:integrase/recombinase XerC
LKSEGRIHRTGRVCPAEVGRQYVDRRGERIACLARVITAILRTLKQDGGPLARRDAAIIRLLFDVALRRAEVVGFDTGDLDLAHGKIRIKGKGRTQKEWIGIPPPTVAALRAWLRVRGTVAGPVFLCFTRYGHARRTPARLSGFAVHKLVREYGLEHGVKLWPHGLRHAAITEAVNVAPSQGITLPEVLQCSRHSKLTTLQGYYDQCRVVQGTLASVCDWASRNQLSTATKRSRLPLPPS